MPKVLTMVEILHDELPGDLVEGQALPGVRPLTDETWLQVDAAYSAQMAYRRQLIDRKRGAVLYEGAMAKEAVSELWTEAMSLLPALGFGRASRHVFCPDGACIDTEADSELATLGRILQEDLCIMQKVDSEHVLTAAVLCFPASWTLSEKVGQPLSNIHRPVDAYDEQIAKRVQRLFDGVQVGRPLWRNNMLEYVNPDLHQPRAEASPERERPSGKETCYTRAERQCIVRLPQTGAVVFSIHSYVVKQNAK